MGKNPEFLDTQEWPPFFHMPVLMLMLITLLNDGTLITIGYDIAVAPKTPPKGNMPFLFSMAAVQAFVAMISSVNLLYILLQILPRWHPDRRSCRKPALHVGSLCVDLVSVLVVR